MARKSLDEILCGEKRFGKYTVLGEGDPHPKSRYVLCRCDCGEVKQVEASRLRSGRSTRCKSCAAKNPARITNKTHGRSATPEYQAWHSMKGRCCNPNAHNYADYGGRGIGICDEWMRSFEAFYADMGPRPDGHSLDRIDNNSGYSPENCRWADLRTQQRNRRVTRMVTWMGEERPVSELEAEAGLPRGVLGARLDMGWPIERAMTEPSAVKRPRHNVFGESLTTKQICERYGIARQVFNYRLRVKGMTAEQAVVA